MRSNEIKQGNELILNSRNKEKKPRMSYLQRAKGTKERTLDKAQEQFEGLLVLIAKEWELWIQYQGYF